MTGYQSKRAAAQDKLVVTDIDGHVVRDARKPKKVAQDKLAQPEQEPVMILPDGSAFGVMSFPLPDDHWLVSTSQYDLPKPILTHALRDAVVAAVRYAVRGATMRGQETDFDPDALVQNAVYALCGPYTTPPQRPWVGLTESEWFNWWRVSQVADATQAEIDFADFLIIAQAVVAKLKEKQT